MAINQNLTVTLNALDKTTAAFESLNKNLNGLRDAAIKVGAALVSAFAIRDIVSSTEQFATSVRRLQAETGLTAEAASRLAFTAKVVGIQTDELAISLARLAKNMFAVHGEQLVKGTDVFAKWGVSIRDVNGVMLRTEQVLANVSERVRQLGNSQAAAALEQDLFSRSGTQMHEFLMLGADGMRQFAEMSDRFHRTLTAKEVDDLIAFTRESRALGEAFEGLKVQLGILMLPILQEAVSTISRWVTNVTHAVTTNKEFAGGIKAIADALHVAVGIVKEVLDRFGQFIADIKTIGLGGAIEKLFTDALAKAKEVLPKIGAELDKMGPVGFALKLIALSAAVSLASGVGGLLFGGLIDALAVGATFAKWSLGAGATSFSATVGLGLTLLLMAAAPVLAERFNFPLLTDIGLLLAPLAAVQGFRLAVALGADTPVGLAVSAGIAIGIVSADLIDKIPEGSFLAFLKRPAFWANALLGGLAAIAAITIIGVSGGTALAVGAAVMLTLDIAGMTINWPGGGAFASPPAGLPVNPFVPPPPGPPIPQGGGTRGIPGIPNIVGTFQGVPIAQETLNLIRSVGGGGTDLIAFQHGGVVTRPTLGLIGEAGPEAVVPLGAGGAGGTTVNIFVSGNVARSERELAERIADQVGEVLVRKVFSQRSLAY